MSGKRRGGVSEWEAELLSGIAPLAPARSSRARARTSNAPSRRSAPPPRPSTVHAVLRSSAGDYEVDLARGFELARPIATPAARAPSAADDRSTLAPAAETDATRTLGLGVLVDELVAVGSLVGEPFLPALLVTAPPVKLATLVDEVRGERRGSDMVVGRPRLVEGFARATAAAPAGFTPSALVLRTGGEARARAADGRAPPWLTLDAVRFLRARGIDHVLVDLPSLDPPALEGDGAAAPRREVLRAFFGMPEGGRAVRALVRAPPRRTVTERVLVPDALDDGAYVVALGLPAIVADVVPSRPTLYSVGADPVG